MKSPNNINLTKREYQIAGLAFCGLAKKEMADKLNIAYGTVNIHTDNAYKKTGTSKLNELGAKWANMVFGLDIDFDQLKKILVALSFFGVALIQPFANDNVDWRRPRNLRSTRRRTEIIYEKTI